LSSRIDESFIPAEEPEKDVDFSRYWSVIVKRWRLIVLCVGVALAAGFTISALAPLYYRATATVSVERQSIMPADVGVPGAGLDAYYYNPEFLPTQMLLMRGREIVQRVVERLHLTMNEQLGGGQRRAIGKAADPTPDEVAQVARAIQAATSVTQVQGTSLVEISFTSGNAKLAADVANALGDAYIEWTLESRMKLAGQASQFLATQIEQLKAEIDDRERKLLAYGRQKDIISMSPSSNVTLQKLDTLTREYTAAVTDRINKEVRLREIQTAAPETIATSRTGSRPRSRRRWRSTRTPSSTTTSRSRSRPSGRSSTRC
jgi:uncharacterized protein involved in exopolysaccharide biosynthesis